MTADTAFRLVVGVAAIVAVAAHWYIDHRQQPLYRWDIDVLLLTAAERERLRAKKTMSLSEYRHLLRRSLAEIYAEIERCGLDPAAPHKKRF